MSQRSDLSAVTLWKQKFSWPASHPLSVNHPVKTNQVLQKSRQMKKKPNWRITTRVQEERRSSLVRKVMQLHQKDNRTQGAAASASSLSPQLYIEGWPNTKQSSSPDRFSKRGRPKRSGRFQLTFEQHDPLKARTGAFVQNTLIAVTILK